MRRLTLEEILNIHYWMNRRGRPWNIEDGRIFKNGKWVKSK